MVPFDGDLIGALRPAVNPRPHLRSFFHHQRPRRGHRPGPRDLSARRQRSRRQDRDRRFGARRGAVRGGAAGGARERGDEAHRLSRPSVLQDARAVEAEDDQAGDPERHQQRGESPVEPESTGPNGGGDEPGDAREEAQDHDFLPRHQDAEHVAPAEHAHGEEHQAVRDLDGVDQVERPREEAKQSEYRVAREVQREREGNGPHAVKGHGVKIPVWKPRVHISSCRGKASSGPGSARSPTSSSSGSSGQRPSCIATVTAPSARPTTGATAGIGPTRRSARTWRSPRSRCTSRDAAARSWGGTSCAGRPRTARSRSPTSGCSRTPSATASASISCPARCATPGPSDRRACGCTPARSIIRPRSRTTRSAGSCRTRRRRTRLTSPCDFHALADAQADHRRRADRARAAVRAVYVVRPDVDLLERRARRLRAEVFQEGVDLQDLGGRTGLGVHPGDDVGEVLFHRAGRFRRRAHQPEPGQARGAELQTAHGHPDELLRRDRVFRRGREGRGMTTTNSFGARAPLKAAGGTFEIFRLDALERRGLPVARLPYSLRILLENLLRREDGRTVTPAEIERLARWDPTKTPDDEIAFMPARVLMQDFTGVPAVVDFAAMRDAMQGMGGDPKQVNPLLPAELVIDHSVIVDEFGTPTAFQVNADLEFQRNRERYALLRWAQQTFRGFRVVPPDTGIVHQVNLEYLARVVFTDESPAPQAYSDTLVGTDSHTTMINGLGVLGWGVGGIEAEAAMLGQPVSMLIPQVVGFRLTGRLAEGATATDLVLTVTELRRKKGVVGKFVEFYGPGIATLPLADRATIGNMAPEYGATVGIFPVDQETLRYLEFTGRPKEQVQLVEAYMKEQGLFHSGTTTEPVYSDTLSLDLSTVEPSLAGPRRPQDRESLRDLPRKFQLALPSPVKTTSPIAPPP